jgi:hypothetical protein
MSTAPVPSEPTHSELANFDVDNSIAGRHMGEMINNTSFLLGKNVANVCCSYPAQVHLAELSNVSPYPETFFDANYQWFYTRSPDVQFVFLETECWKSIFLGQRIAYNMTLSASLPAGASYATPEDESSFRRNAIAMDQTGNTDFPSTRTGIIDVSGLSTTVPTLFSLNISGSTAGLPPLLGLVAGSYRGGGISKINMQEVPLRFLNVSGAGQSGSSDIISVVPFRRIVDGDANQEYGLARILDQTVKAKTRVRNQWQIVNHQSTQPILNPIDRSGVTAGATTIWFSNTAAATAVNFQTPGSSANNVFYIRTRNYVGAGSTFFAPNFYRLYVRYRTEVAAPFADCLLRMTHRNEASGISAVENLVLPSSTAWTTVSSGLIGLECGEWIFNREQLVRLSFEGGVGSLAPAGQVIYFSAFYLVEEE